MQRVDEFLQAVEARLRCPVDRRPSVIEELRGHVSDRTEALVHEGISVPDAERRAIREIGPAWILALRLSAANGWNVTAHVLRELWAAGLAFLLVTITPQASHTMWPKITHHPPYVSLSAGMLVMLGLWYLFVLAGLAGFGFAMGRTVRGWLWAAIAILGVAANALHLLLQPGGLAAAAAVLVSAFLGQRRGSPKLQWLAWVSVGLIAASIPGIWTVTSGVQVGAVLADIGGAALAAIGGAALAAIGVLAVPWVFWLGAWVIERAARTASRDLASSS